MTPQLRAALRKAISEHPELADFLADPQQAVPDPAWEGGHVSLSEGNKHVDQVSDSLWNKS